MLGGRGVGFGGAERESRRGVGRDAGSGSPRRAARPAGRGLYTSVHQRGGQPVRRRVRFVSRTRRHRRCRRAADDGSPVLCRLWEGDGNNLQMDNNELRITWNSGFFTRSRNVVSLSLDQIVRPLSVVPAAPAELRSQRGRLRRTLSRWCSARSPGSSWSRCSSASFSRCAPPSPDVLSKPCSILRSTGAEMAQSWNVLRSGPVALWPGGSVTRWPGGPVAL